jgi:hypothetical protein
VTVAPEVVRDDAGTVTLGAIRVSPAQPRTFLVAGRATVTLDSGSPASVMLAVFGVRCLPPGGSSGESSPPQVAFSQGQNLIRGQTVVLAPQFLSRLSGSSQWTCSMVLRFSRSPQAAGPNFIHISGASLTVKGPLLNGPVQQGGGSSILLEPGATNTPLQAQWRVPKARLPVTLLAEFELTACTSVSGSRDPTTDGRELCEDVKNPNHPGVAQVQLIGYRRPLRSRARCLWTRTPVSPRVVTIDAITHHLVVTLTRRLTLGQTATCSPILRAWVKIGAEPGTAVMFNAPQALLAVIPGV